MQHFKAYSIKTFSAIDCAADLCRVAFATNLRMFELPKVFKMNSISLDRIRHFLYGSVFASLMVISPSMVVGQAPELKLSAEDAVSIALERNFGIQIARNRAEMARLANNPGDAGFIPDVDFRAGYAATRDQVSPTISGVSQPRLESDTDVVDAQLALNWTIFDGLQMFATRDRLRSLEALGQVEFRVQAEQIISDVLAAYHNIVRLGKRVEVLENTVDITHERFRIADMKQQIGTGSEYDVLLARADLNADIATVRREQVLLNDARLRLLRLLAVDEQTSVEVDSEIRLQTTLDDGDLLASITMANTSLESATIFKDIARLQRQELIRGRLPKLEVSAAYGLSSRESNSPVPRVDDVNGYRYGVTLRVPILDGLNLNRRLETARLAERNALLLFEQEEMLIRSLALAELENYRASLEIVAIEQENLLLVEETLQIALQRFTTGTISSLELRESQRALINTETRLIGAFYEAKLSETELLRLAGRLMN